MGFFLGRLRNVSKVTVNPSRCDWNVGVVVNALPTGKLGTS
jgi:hypothetical protein